MHRDRDDLPRTLPEFQYLTVYEVDDDFRAAAPGGGRRPATTSAGTPDRARVG